MLHMHAAAPHFSRAAPSPTPCPPPPPLTGTFRSFCNAHYGRNCVADIIASACPAVTRSPDSSWAVSADPTLLCSSGCFQQLCSSGLTCDRL